MDVWCLEIVISKIYTHIHNWSLQSFSQDYDQVSQTTYVVCFNFYTWVAGPTVLSLLRATNFWETSRGSFYLLPEFLPEICWKKLRFETQAGHQNKIRKIFLRRFPLRRFLTKTLSVNKIAVKGFSKNLSVEVDFKL